MNFLDTFDIARSATPNPDQPTPEQPTLNEEVNQVIGQLGRFWGGFRKQSQSALETARKDFSEVVVQAQKELSKLTVAEEPTETRTREGEAVVDETNEASSASTEVNDSTPTHEATEAQASGSSSSNQGFLSRLQASLPPNIVATVQNNIPDSIKHASENIDLQQLRTNLVTDFQRVQGVTLAQAEEYMHKSEALLREAMKEAGEVLRDAVKVVPPEEGASSSSGLTWDGSDMWMLPYETGESSNAPGPGSGKEKTGSSSKAAEVQTAAVATRAEALLRRLKNDASILRHDPETEEGSRDPFVFWREKEVDSKDGGIDGAEWSSKITSALDEPTDGQSLKQLEETLVPSEMTKSAFWLRFFFRSHQIRSEEEKRKALIHSSTETDEDFSWEDDEEESSANKATRTTEVDDKLLKGGIPPTAATLSPDGPTKRVGSEDSFDLVSSASANASVAGDAEKVSKPKPEEDDNDNDDDADSDWE